MKESSLPFDRSKHALYTKNVKKCVMDLLHRYYDEQTTERLWENIQLQYCEFLKDEPALGGVKITTSIYDPILVFAWYAVVPDKPEGHFRVGKGYLLHYLADSIGLGDVLLHELPPGRDVVEQVADDYCGAVGTAPTVVESLTAAFDRVQRAVLLMLLLGHDLNSGYC